MKNFHRVLDAWVYTLCRRTGSMRKSCSPHRSPPLSQQLHSWSNCCTIVFLCAVSASLSGLAALYSSALAPLRFSLAQLFASNTDPGNPFRNYTLLPQYPWPVSNSSLRGVVVSLWAGRTSTFVEEFRTMWPRREEHFLAPLKDHCDQLIFYTVYPTNDRRTLLHLAHNFSWVVQYGENRLIIPRLRQHSNFMLNSEGDEFVTPLGVHVLLFPIIMSFPSWLAEDAGLLERDDWNYCFNHHFPLDYELFSGAIFNHRILAHPVLATYDYYLNMNFDVLFYNRVPFSPFHFMRQQGCVWLHTQFVRGLEDCTINADHAALEWAKLTGHQPASGSTEFFHLTSDYYYGNFVGGWMGYLRAPENLELMHHLENNKRYPGYYKHRWGDQPAYSLILGMWYNITDKQASGNASVQAICDLSRWRDSVFTHIQ